MKETITEVCSLCDAENTFEWDTETEGYRAFCQHCGAELMLCNACMSEDTKCDWGDAHCYRKIAQAEKHEVACRFVRSTEIVDETRTVLLFTEEDRYAFASAMEGENIDYQFDTLESLPIKANSIIPAIGGRLILNNGDDCMAVRCSDGWLVASVMLTGDRWRAINIGFCQDNVSEDDVAELGAYVEENIETGELSVRVWPDAKSDDYTHKIILREKNFEEDK